ncbi:MAG: hypothetical protein PHO32_02565 [Candidatus Cloacimonetes bacterium]|nr:hypothetical protein [Candidatus Cloacimonadota bacterium]
MLLTASYYFYFSAKAEYLIILLVSTAVNYLSGVTIARHQERKKIVLSLSLVFNLGVLFFFKYFNFVGSQLNTLFDSFSLPLSIPHHSLILPIGISFYTFMAIGYVLDVYWGDIKCHKNYLTFSLYMSFFPQILCGPIGRAKNLFVQFTTDHPLQYDNFANGFRLILWGLFKKMVVADNIAVYVDAVFNNTPMHSSLTVIVATLLFPIQLYADFSGYTDIARGVAKLLGYNLMVNFRTPYVNSTSVTDYWKRNHISLTSWFRDYVFYPFLGTSTSKYKLYLGIFIMFLASGIWHGASWMFVIWGIIQAVYLIIDDLTGIAKHRSSNIIVNVLKRTSTFVLLSFGLVFFRLASVGDIMFFYRAITKCDWALFIGTRSNILNILSGILILFACELVIDKKQIDEYIMCKRYYLRWSLYIGLIILMFLCGNWGGGGFLYYKF